MSIDNTWIDNYLRWSGQWDWTVWTSGWDLDSLSWNCNINKEKIILTWILSDNLSSNKNYILSGVLQISGVVNIPKCISLLGWRLIFGNWDKLNFTDSNIILDSVIFETNWINNLWLLIFDVSNTTPPNIFSNFWTNSTIYRSNIFYKKDQNIDFFKIAWTWERLTNYTTNGWEYILKWDLIQNNNTWNLNNWTNILEITIITWDWPKNIEIQTYLNSGQINSFVRHFWKFELDQTSPVITWINFTTSGTSITWYWNTAESSLCQYRKNYISWENYNSSNIFANSYILNFTWNYGTWILELSCMDSLNNIQIKTWYFHIPLPKAILSSPTTNQLLSGWNISFSRNFQNSGFLVPKYKVVIFDNTWNILNSWESTTKSYIQNLTTWTYLRKVISNSGDLYSESLTGKFFVNVFSGNINFPDRFEIIANSWFTDEFVPIIIKAKKWSDISTGFNRKVKFYITWTNLTWYNILENYQRNTWDFWVVKFVDKFKFTKSGSYTLVIQDLEIPALNWSINIQIYDHTNRRFQHLANLELNTNYISNSVIANFITWNTGISCPNCEIFVNWYNKSYSTTIAKWDKVQIRLSSSSSYDTYILEKIKIWQNYYSFGLLTKKNDGKIDKSEVFLTNYMLSPQIYLKLLKATYQMLIWFGIKWYDMNQVKNSLSGTIQNKIRESEQKQLYNNLNTVRNNALIYKTIYIKMFDIIKNFKIKTKNIFSDSVFGLYFEYPIVYTKNQNTWVLYIQSWSNDILWIRKIYKDIDIYKNEKIEYLKKYKSKNISDNYKLSDYKITKSKIWSWSILESTIFALYMDWLNSNNSDYIYYNIVFKNSISSFELFYKDFDYQKHKQSIDLIKYSIK